MDIESGLNSSTPSEVANVKSTTEGAVVQKPEEALIKKPTKQLTCISDLLLSNSFELGNCLISIAITIVQFAVYIVVLDSDVDIYSAAVPITSLEVSFMYAAVAITATGYNFLMTLYLNVAASFVVNGITPNSVILSPLLFGNLSLLFVAVVQTVPRQGTPVNIILNATAILAVSQLDVLVFQCVKYHTCTNEEVVKEKERVTKLKPIRLIMAFLFYGGCFFVFVSLLIVFAISLKK